MKNELKKMIKNELTEMGNMILRDYFQLFNNWDNGSLSPDEYSRQAALKLNSYYGKFTAYRSVITIDGWQGTEEFKEELDYFLKNYRSLKGALEEIGGIKVA